MLTLSCWFLLDSSHRVSICQGFSHFPGVLPHFVLAKLATSSPRVKDLEFCFSSHLCQIWLIRDKPVVCGGGNRSTRRKPPLKHEGLGNTVRVCFTFTLSVQYACDYDKSKAREKKPSIYCFWNPTITRVGCIRKTPILLCCITY